MAPEHYFSSAPTGPFSTRRIRVTLGGREVEVETAGGVFSPEHVDLGTRVLLDTMPPPPATGDVLDLGCGWGPIALHLATAAPDARVWAVDVNQRALDLVRRNAARLGLGNITAATPDEVPDDVRFATIRSNPPIRIGKAELHALLRRWLPRLAPDAAAWLVVQKNLGSDSLQRWLDDEFDDLVVDRAASSKGFRVLTAVRRG